MDKFFSYLNSRDSGRQSTASYYGGPDSIPE